MDKEVLKEFFILKYYEIRGFLKDVAYFILLSSLAFACICVISYVTGFVLCSVIPSLAEIQPEEGIHTNRFFVGGSLLAVTFFGYCLCMLFIDWIRENLQIAEFKVKQRREMEKL
jgi:hypothetical protein